MPTLLITYELGKSNTDPGAIDQQVQQLRGIGHLMTAEKTMGNQWRVLGGDALAVLDLLKFAIAPSDRVLVCAIDTADSASQNLLSDAPVPDVHPPSSQPPTSRPKT